MNTQTTDLCCTMHSASGKAFVIWGILEPDTVTGAYSHVSEKNTNKRG